jgi:hypothetical protein
MLPPIHITFHGYEYIIGGSNNFLKVHLTILLIASIGRRQQGASWGHGHPHAAEFSEAPLEIMEYFVDLSLNLTYMAPSNLCNDELAPLVSNSWLRPYTYVDIF